MTTRRLDALFLVVVSLLPACFYVFRLGFYLDDYQTLALLSTSHDRSVPGLIDALFAGDPKSQLRPFEYVLLAGGYKLFGTSPWPYHVLLVLVIPLSALFLYLVLERLRQPRFLTLGLPLLFATAPHYSSGRFWLAAFMPTTSVLLFLVSFYCGLRGLETRGRRLGAWFAAGAASMLASVFMYEVALPLFLLGAVFLWYRARRDGLRDRRIAATSFGALFVAAAGIKFLLALKIGNETSYAIGYQAGFLHDTAYLVSGSIKVNFITYGLAFPYVLGWIFDHRFSWPVLTASVLVGTLTFLYLRHRPEDLQLPSGRQPEGRRRVWREIAVAGLLLFVAGYAVFAVTGEIYFTSAGIDNRVNVVAALGMGLLAIGLLLRGLELLPVRRRVTAFSLGAALLASAGVLVTNTLAADWTAAYSRQQAVLHDVREALPARPSQTTLILDGVCPEVGPGVVFAAPYDLGGALETAYRDATIKAAVTTPTVDATRRGLVISTFLFNRFERSVYPYGNRVLVYDWRRKSTHRLAAASDARRYFSAAPRPDCPPLRSFAWGVHVSRWVPLD